MFVSSILVSCMVVVISARPEPEAPTAYNYSSPPATQRLALPVSEPARAYLPGPNYISPSTYLSPSPSAPVNPSLYLSSPAIPEGPTTYLSPSPAIPVSPTTYLSPSPAAPVIYSDSYAAQAPIIQKHVYVHVAPEEPQEVLTPLITAPQSPPRKHYKIVFIKAPNPPVQASTQIQIPQRDEEKTLIYVLSKKNQEAGSINIAAPPSTPPTKPEVFFIRYKNREDQASTLGAPLYTAPLSPNTRYGAPLQSDSIVVNASPSSTSGPY